MKIKLLLPLIVLAGIVIAHGDDEKLPILKVGNETYTNVIVTKVTAVDISFIHAGGMANAKLKALSPVLQKQFHYDSKQAQAAEQKLAENKAQYQRQILHQPAVQPPDMTRPKEAPAAGGEAVWRTDYPGALQQAKAENKLVLLDFTGSDWCGWCKKFEQDVLSTPKFAAYAGRKLQLVRLDFPHHTPQPDALRRANAALSNQFKVDGFPTFVLLNGDGKELGRQDGYMEGGPDAFIAELENWSR
jgi:protein disulfide-isomerase